MQRAIKPEIGLGQQLGMLRSRFSNRLKRLHQSEFNSAYQFNASRFYSEARVTFQIVNLLIVESDSLASNRLCKNVTESGEQLHRISAYFKALTHRQQPTTNELRDQLGSEVHKLQ